MVAGSGKSRPMRHIQATNDQFNAGPAGHLRMHEFQEEVRRAGIRQERRMRLNAYIKKHSPCSEALARGEGNVWLAEGRNISNNTRLLPVDVPTMRNPRHRFHAMAETMTPARPIPSISITPARPIPSISITPPKEDGCDVANPNGSPPSASSIKTVIRVSSSDSSASASPAGSGCFQQGPFPIPKAADLDIDVYKPDGDNVSMRPGPKRTAEYLASLYDDQGKLIDPTIPGVSRTIDEEHAATRVAWRKLTRPSITKTPDGCIIQKGFVVPKASKSSRTPSPQMHVRNARSDYLVRQQRPPAPVKQHAQPPTPEQRRNSGFSSASSLNLYSSSVDKIVYCSPGSEIDNDELLETECGGGETPIDLSLYPPTLLPSNTPTLSLCTGPSQSLTYYENHCPNYRRKVRIVAVEEAESAIQSEDEDEVESLLPSKNAILIKAKPRAAQTPATQAPVTQISAVPVPVARNQVAQAPAVPKGILKKPTPPLGFAGDAKRGVCETWVV